MPDDTRLHIEIKNAQPIELLDLNKSLFGIAEEYKRFSAAGLPPAEADEMKLYVSEIKTGSIIAELVAATPAMLPLFVEHANSLVEFCKFLHTAYEFLLGKRKDKPQQLEKIDFQALTNIVEPVAKDNGSQLNIGALTLNNPVIQFNLSSLEANAAQNAAKREIEKLQEPVTGVKEQALLYWYQARNDPRSQAGDKAIVESVYRGPVKAVFSNESIKTKMLLDTDNPFTHAYVVDLAVETIRGKPALYRILDVHDKIEKPSEDSSG
ncbi:MAG TPA: hypothetical protein VGI60_14565 [Chthoniobacterales bacterium]|jgi:hypothetical protein